MSYPKKHPAASKDTDRETKNSVRREQMKNLLITKFRGKFNVTGGQEYTDRLIRSEVETFLNNDQMTEQNLIKLDKKLSELVAQDLPKRGASIGREHLSQTMSVASSRHSRRSDAA
jgi:hypothetical protein